MEPQAEPDDPRVLRVAGIRKTFPGVVALDGVDFDLRAGEVHVLLGENGAGKSTLIKILSGAHRPDAGRIMLDGAPVRLSGPRDAERLGIATIYQELAQVPELSVAENLFLGRPPRRLGFVDRRRMEADAARLLDRVGVPVDPRARMRDLGIAHRQLVEIARALGRDARVLIMDEPTAALTGAEVDRLFHRVRALRANGVAVVFITHHLEEIAAIGDRVTVLRDGRSVTQVPAHTDRDTLVRLMVGRAIEQQYPRASSAPDRPGRPLLSVAGLTRAGSFHDVSFEVRAGEVVALAGLVGAGRTEVVRAVFGADPYDAGSVTVLGRRLPPHDVGAALRAGIGLVPEDRKGQGLLLDASVADNLGLVTLRGVTRAGLVDRAAQRTAATRVADRLAIRTVGLDHPVRTLSGGNQQKVVIGKWLLAESGVLILDEPTRGIDVAAKVEIYRLVNELTAAGRAVLMVSSDLPEVLGMSDRVLVMAQGRIAGELDAREATQDAVMALAVGATTAHSPTDSADPANTATPANTAIPANPADRAHPADADRANPTEPARPGEPTKPRGPGNATEPDKATRTSEATKATRPKATNKTNKTSKNNKTDKKGDSDGR
ncbi:sugar ABC transporter ATP-binding protein [Streptomyces buecherae]|uniref:sugar ABC transporter ATP-binding protein n=1 Tax=Streptomyces buecherae TaxID=2763006 RepID=UPI00379C718F